MPEIMKILDIQYNNFSVEEALKQSALLLNQEGKDSIFFLNSDCLYKTQYDKEYRDILNSADLVLPDGVGLKIISWIFGEKMKENCNGTDFSPRFMEETAKKGYKIFLLGSKDGIAQRAGENIKRSIPNINIVGTHPGYFSNDKEVVQKINASGADILFVAMGVPLQEKWIARNRDKLNPKLCLGVGALLDYLSGNIRRAPLFMRRMHLEWLWRIFIEPKRMFKRYIIDGSKLFWIVMKYKLCSR